ncbi:M14 family metallopeptidase [Shewanella fidelis]|uniref:M14 family metallocarboxypeptidase n=1 Tax=Shewanella fidelis TaxID=173509 RepID=A0AAW8NQ23_9GAMM|nr:M14 family metallocarboxypeptidase [Shewanella fidelis]MDR8524291.1 M14 family metallocarboxypeptidase [Shewanella fidelis]MDW4813500.1 M14 family metallocarboxypeptidase [Shewanella fidelis]MDW4817577.1 M14 family metallocarboxypeptidase [Shewanella fidelis]MDW4821644.1 M14 family metallocarboxypeptidase [Shewanella fidelis]MDW4825809.1 M14 family metallocarboxypeptidase [Shewanella fidelis]
MDQQVYAIGVKGQKWGEAEKAQWLNGQSVKRSYHDEVLVKILALKERFELEQYGALSYDVDRYPLYAVKSKNWDLTKPTILVTGGVHGYETSGVQGAIRFTETKAADYAKAFNILVVPCISPWGYETINRWNPNAVDPNRSFYADSPAEESAALIKLLADLGVEIFAHIDLHETTDTDNSEFRPALAARDAVEHSNWNIPDGFYLVGDTINPQDAFQTAMIEAVAKVTHIAPADEDGKLIGVELAQFGVINYATKALGLCAGVTDAKYVTTTEVYPDSPLVDDENCIVAQVAAITGGLDHLLSL